jgi:hypothetical protein
MLSVTGDSRGSARQHERCNDPSRNNEGGCNLFVRAAPRKVVIRVRRRHLRLSATGSLSTLLAVAGAFATDLTSDIEGRRIELGASLQASTAPGRRTRIDPQ